MIPYPPGTVENAAASAASAASALPSAVPPVAPVNAAVLSRTGRWSSSAAVGQGAPTG
jgi:hypothetical protein